MRIFSSLLLKTMLAQASIPLRKRPTLSRGHTPLPLRVHLIGTDLELVARARSRICPAQKPTARRLGCYSTGSFTTSCQRLPCSPLPNPLLDKIQFSGLIHADNFSLFGRASIVGHFQHEEKADVHSETAKEGSPQMGA